LNDYCTSVVYEDFHSAMEEFDISPESYWDFVRDAILFFMDKKSDDHKKLGILFAELKTDGILNTQHVIYLHLFLVTF
jgi:hypothetical protein